MADTELKIIELDTFDTAFPVNTGQEETVRRRFLTLFVQDSGRLLAGSMGLVYKAQNALGEVFAVKQLKLTPEEAAAHAAAQVQFGSDQEAAPDDELSETQRLVRGRIAAFQEEYRVQLAFSRLKGFPKLYGIGYENGLPLIVMEWVEGITLSAARNSLPRAVQTAPTAAPATRKLKPAIDRTVVAQLALSLFGILAGVESMRERSAHRDISPHNIMIRTDQKSLEEQAKAGEFDLCLIDFGSATMVEERSASFTMVSDIWRNGTPEYAPPEMLTHDIANVMELRQSPSIDVYAACSILYELFAGHPPFCVGDHKETSPYRLKVDTEAIPLGCLNARERALATVIMSGLAPLQADRPTATKLQAQIQSWLNVGKPNVSQTAKPVQPAAKPATARITAAPKTAASNTSRAHLSALSTANGGARVSGAKGAAPVVASGAVSGPANTSPTPVSKYLSADKRPAQPLVIRNNQKKSRRTTIASVVILALIALTLIILAKVFLG